MKPILPLFLPLPMTNLFLFLLAGLSICWGNEPLDECSCFWPEQQEQEGGDNATTTRFSSSSNAALKIFYLVLVHNERTADDAIHLIRSIRHPSNTILIHIDAKVAHLAHDSALQREVARCPCGAATMRLESVHSVEWSKWSMNLPTLWGMDLAVSTTAGGLLYADWDVFINLSGDTVPVYDVDTTANVLAQLPYNFVTSKACETGLFPTSVYELPKVWHKRRHYTHDETEADPVFPVARTPTGGGDHGDNGHYDEVSITTHFGSQWIILQRDFCEWLIHQLADPASWVSQFRDYLMASGKLMTDETFIPTVLMYAPERFPLPLVTSAADTNDTDNVGQQQQQRLIYANGTVSDITHLRYERMDEHFPTAAGLFPDRQRYQIPKSLLPTIDQPRVWGPYFLGVYDLGDIRATGALYARKISALVDDNMVRLLPVRRREDIPNIHWPRNEISIIDQPDWSQEREMLARVIAGGTAGTSQQAVGAAADDEEL
jgi:Core-2/I-Branching enzyme